MAVGAGDHDPAEGLVIGADHGQSRRQCLKAGQALRFASRRRREHVAEAIETMNLVSGHGADHVHARFQAALGDEGSQPRGVRSVADDEPLPRHVRHPGEQVERLGEILLRRDAADGEHHRDIRHQADGRRQLGASGRAETAEVHASADDVDGGADPVAAEDVGDLGGRGDDAVGAVEHVARPCPDHRPAQAAAGAEVVRVVLVQRVIRVHVGHPESPRDGARPPESRELGVAVDDVRRPLGHMSPHLRAGRAAEPGMRVHRAGRNRREAVHAVVEDRSEVLPEGEHPDVVSLCDQALAQVDHRPDHAVYGRGVAVGEQQDAERPCAGFGGKAEHAVIVCQS